MMKFLNLRMILLGKSRIEPKILLSNLFESERSKYKPIFHLNGDTKILGYLSEITFWEKTKERSFRYKIQLHQDEVIKVYQSSIGYNVSDKQTTDIEMLSINMNDEKWRDYSFAKFAQFFWNEFYEKREINLRKTVL